jgi:two-component system cell cycle response regulator
LDYNLGDESGFLVLERVKARHKPIPSVIMLTGDERQSTVIKALRLGIDDYLPKHDLRPEPLISAIGHAIQKNRREQLTAAQHQRLAAASNIDLVSGLTARSHLEERLIQLVTMEPRVRAAYGLILVELNELTKIVGQFGLKAGDRVVRAFGERLRVGARNNDICGRYTANTFLVIVDTRSEPSILGRICEKMVEELCFHIELDTTSLALSASVAGVFCAESARSPTDLTEPALQALAAARAATNCLHVPERRSNHRAVSPIAVKTETSLANALEPLPAASPLRTSDRRRDQRQRVLKRGQIIIPSLNGIIDCNVRNVSASGAALRIDATVAVPLRFELLIAGAAGKQQVQVKWQAGRDIGVEYIK